MIILTCKKIFKNILIIKNNFYGGEGLIKAVVGLNWGDEGKGKMVDYFASIADCVIRFHGGNNAGHTINNEYGRFAVHSVPAGICYEKVLNIIASGCVVNPESFIKEINKLQNLGINTSNVYISDRAITILPFHIILDKAEEGRLKEKKFDSTLRGIAPVYGDKYLKKGIQIGELLYIDELKDKLIDLVHQKNYIIANVYSGSQIDFDEMIKWLKHYSIKLRPYIKNIKPIIETLLMENKEIVLEGHIGALRDINHGIYPYTTSSSSIAGYAAASIPIPPKKIDNIIGVTKAYSTCVGAGPFVTEIKSKLADLIRVKGNEYGVTTKRPRRIGYFDAVATAYGSYLQGTNEVALTGLQVLSGINKLKICTAYKIGNDILKEFPLCFILEKVEPVYEEIEGWDEDISQVKRYDDFPIQVKQYIEKIESILGIPIKYISLGIERDSLIIR